MHRASTPLRCITNGSKRVYNVEDEVDGDENKGEVVIPVMVLELNAPSEDHQSENGDQTIEEGEGHQEEEPSPVAIKVTNESAENVNGTKVVSRRHSDGNDTSWAKIKKKTSPVVNASVVFMYLVLSTMFVFGWVSLNSCTVNPLIPVYLIVAGSTGILTKALIRTRNKHLFNVVILLVLFDLCWQAFGSYIVYREYQPNYDPTISEVYCHRMAYLLAFWLITIVYSLIGLFILLSSCYFLMRNTFTKT